MKKIDFSMYKNTINHNLLLKDFSAKPQKIKQPFLVDAAHQMFLALL